MSVSLVGQRRRGRPAHRLVVVLLLALALLGAGSLSAHAATPPSNAAPPTVSGDPFVGTTLLASSGRWSGDPLPTYTYRWQYQNGDQWVDIPGATTASYVIQPAYLADALRVNVTASNGATGPGGKDPEQVSNATAPVRYNNDPPDKPDPPLDVLGSPNNSRVVSAEGLLLQERRLGDTALRAAVVKTNTSGDVDEGPYPVRTGDRWDTAETRYLLTTVKGRFNSQANDGALTAQHTSFTSSSPDATGLVLSSVSQDAVRGTDPVGRGGAVVPGKTYSFRNWTTNDLQINEIRTSAREFNLVVQDFAGPSSWWTAAPDPSGSAYVQLVNKASGRCLSTARYPQLTDWCEWGPSVPPAQQWRLQQDADERRLVSRDGGKTLTYSDNDGFLYLSSYSQSNKKQLVLNEEWSAPAGSPVSSAAGGDVLTWSADGISRGTKENPLVAAGDLDRVSIDGDEYSYHDEAVLVQGSTLKVIDYEAQTGRITVTTSDGIAGAAALVQGAMGIGVGDFDGDSLHEIAVLSNVGGAFRIGFFGYSAPAAGGRELVLERITNESFADLDATNVQRVTTGDFDGDDRDDLAVVGLDPRDGVAYQMAALSFTAKLGLRGTVSKRINGGSVFTGNPDQFWFRKAELEAGLFLFDPDNGYTMERRQLAVLWSEQSRNPDTIRTVTSYLNTFSVEPDPSCTQLSCKLTFKEANGGQIDVGGLYIDQTPDDRNAPYLPLSMAAGGFKGRGTTGEPPLWGIAVSLNDAPPAQPGTQSSLALYDVGAKLTQLSKRTTATKDGAFIKVTAFDPDGKSLQLGAPAVANVQDFNKATVLAQQPPTHSDWRPDTQQFDNVSRVGDFSVKLSSDDKATYQHTTTNDTTYNVGLTQSASIKNTYKVELGVAGGSGSSEVSEKFSAKFEGSKSDFTKYNTSITTGVSQATADDDIIQGTVVNSTLYRYPILGGPLKAPDGSPVTDPACTTSCYGFYEVLIPGEVTPITTTGKSIDYYQPIWENGNVLSYPTLVKGQVQTPDLDAYTYVDASGQTKSVKAPLFNQPNITVSGNKATVDLQLSSSKGEGNATSAKGGFQVGLNYKQTGSARIGTKEESDTTSTSFSIGINGGASFGTKQSGSTTTASNSSFSLEVPSITTEEAYTIGTIYYYDSAGSVRVAMGADVTANAAGKAYWQDTYGNLPDPALNLPNRTFLTYDSRGQQVEIQFATTASAQAIRGFQALDAANAPLTANPAAGDKVSFTVPVRNYSLKASEPVSVDFYAAPVTSSGTVKNVSPPVKIGTTQTTKAIPAQGSVLVESPPWTAALPSGVTGLQDYRIFVILNANGAPDSEVHPWKDGGKPCPKESLNPKAPAETLDPNGVVIDPFTGIGSTLACGTNNQGYGEVTVSPKTAVSAFQTAGAFNAKRAQVTFGGGGVISDVAAHARLDRGEVARVPVGQQVELIGYTRSQRESAEHQTVLVYDGAPTSDNMIGVTRLDGTSARNGGTARLAWRPTEPGRHTITMVVRGNRVADEDDVVTFKVLVEASPTVAVPEAPTVTQARCVDGRLTAPKVRAASTTGIRYRLVGKPKAGRTVRVTATPRKGYVLPTRLPSGWKAAGQKKAVYRVVLAKPPCASGGQPGPGPSDGPPKQPGPSDRGPGGGAPATIGGTGGLGGLLASTGGPTLAVLIAALILMAGGGALIARRARHGGPGSGT